MVRGKQTCKILKDIRRQIAEANDIDISLPNVNTKEIVQAHVPNVNQKYDIWNINWNDGAWREKRSPY